MLKFNDMVKSAPSLAGQGKATWKYRVPGPHRWEGKAGNKG